MQTDKSKIGGGWGGERKREEIMEIFKVEKEDGTGDKIPQGVLRAPLVLAVI